MLSSDSVRRPMRPNFVFDNERHFDDETNAGELKVEFPVPLGISNIKTVEQEFRKNLDEAGFDLSFTLIKKAGDSTHGKSRRIEIKNRMPGMPESLLKMKSEVLEASFSNPFFYIVKKIQWQLLFALGMLVFTLAAFVFMYRNLRQQHQLAAMKNDFIANITHELKTPVATVSVAIEALKSFNAISDAQRTKEYLDISSLELQRLNLLVDKVMKLSMFEQDKMEIQQERIDMKQLVEEVVKSMKLQFEKCSAEVSMHFEGDTFFTRGDRMHLQSVVFNLLDNGLKYSPDQPKISVELKSLPAVLHLKISDNGIGIASEYKQKVFEKFFRVPHGDTHNIKGYGLGLSYVHEVVQRHGGSISVESKEGAGSIFTVELKREA